MQRQTNPAFALEKSGFAFIFLKARALFVLSKKEAMIGRSLRLLLVMQS